MEPDNILARASSLAIPPGSLGRLHSLATDIVAGGAKCRDLRDVTIFVATGDHGIVESGVALFPQKISRENLALMAEGRASISIFCDETKTKAIYCDCGTVGAFEPAWCEKKKRLGILDLAVADGTRNAVHEPALSKANVQQGFENGYRTVTKYAQHADAVGFGEMGIGNSSIASLLTSSLLNAPLEATVGPGAGFPKGGRSQKTEILASAIGRVGHLPLEPMEALEQFGGHEFTFMIGGMKAAAEMNKVILIDGFISSAAALCFAMLHGEHKKKMVFCTKSSEPGHKLILRWFGAEPLLHLELALGEGTGIALAVPLIRCALRHLMELPTLKELQWEP